LFRFKGPFPVFTISIWGWGLLVESVVTPDNNSRVSEPAPDGVDVKTAVFVGTKVSVAVGGTGVLVLVGGTKVDVAVGGTGVSVGVFVAVNVKVGGTGVFVAVGGAGVFVTVGGAGVLVALGGTGLFVFVGTAVKVRVAVKV
jgi:hypothetical protein